MAHYADITAIDCVLRQLSDDTYARLMVAWRNGGGIEYWSAFFGGWRSHIGPEWAPHIKYRLASPPAVPDFIPWVAVHEQFNWYARDADRSIALYESCPKPKDTLWRSMGQEFPANVIAGIIIGDKPWDQSLVCRPGWEGK